MTRLTRALLISLGLIVILAAAFIAFRGPGKLKAINNYYLEASVNVADVTFSINGFPIEAKTPGQSMLKPIITPYLVNGKNTIDVTYAPNAKSDELSRLTWVILENPSGSKTLDFATRLAEGSIGSRIVSWSELTEQDFTVSRGSIDGRHFFFQRDGRNAVSLGGRLSPELAFTRLPSLLVYYCFPQPITKVSIHFKKSGTPIDVVFSGLTLLGTGQGKIDLSQAAIKSGAQWATAAGFDEILIEGETGKAYGPEVNLSELSIGEIQGIRKDSRVLTLKLPRWHWQDGDRYTAISTGDTDAIWQITQQYHQAIATGDVPKQEALLKHKMISMKQFLPLSSQQWREFETSFYTATGEKLKPISRSGVRITLVNPQVVKVTMPNGEPVIRSIPVNGAHREDELFFSHLSGKWVISL